MSQALEALDRANDVRIANKRTKRALRSGEISLFDAFDREQSAGGRVWSFVGAQRQWGETKTNEFFTKLARRGVIVSPARRVRDLSPRERQVLLESAAAFHGSARDRIRWEYRSDIARILRSGPLSCRTLAYSMGQSSQSITNWLISMERDGLIRRKVVDGRAVWSLPETV